MPQLPTYTDKEREFLATELVKEIPEFNLTNWEQALTNRGINTDSLADMYVSSLGDLKPSARIHAIERLLQSLGVTKVEGPVGQVPVIVINGENVQLNQVLIPQRRLEMKSLTEKTQ